jgi:hypothetical protein
MGKNCRRRLNQPKRIEVQFRGLAAVKYKFYTVKWNLKCAGGAAKKSRLRNTTFRNHRVRVRNLSVKCALAVPRANGSSTTQLRLQQLTLPGSPQPQTTYENKSLST